MAEWPACMIQTRQRLPAVVSPLLVGAVAFVFAACDPVQPPEPDAGEGDALGAVGPGSAGEIAIQAEPGEVAEDAAGDVPYHAERLGYIRHPEINEASGLAASQNVPGSYWLVNDSGARPVLFRIDTRGRVIGRHPLAVRLADAESLTSVAADRSPLGRPLLVVADTGDNRRSRTHAFLHVFAEPALMDASVDPSAAAAGPAALKPLASLRITYADGPRDVEAVAFAPDTGDLVLLSKEVDQRAVVHGHSGLYVLPLAELLDAGPLPPGEPRTLERLADLSITMPTGLSISPNGERLAIAMYGDGRLVERDDGENWIQTLHRRELPPLPLPPRRLGETIAFTLLGDAVVVTSEHADPPLWRVSLP